MGVLTPHKQNRAAKHLLGPNYPKPFADTATAVLVKNQKILGQVTFATPYEEATKSLAALLSTKLRTGATGILNLTKHHPIPRPK